jgi:hypothetical protein
MHVVSLTSEIIWWFFVHNPIYLSVNKCVLFFVRGWVCSMNLWAPHLASCAVPEESMLSATAVKIK